MAYALLERTRCPRCNHITDAVEAPTSTKKPSMGDIVVCTRCAGLLTITNIGSLRELRDAEYRQLSIEQLLQVAEMQKTVAMGKFRR